MNTITFAIVTIALALPRLATAATNDPRPALSTGRGRGRSWRKFRDEGFDHVAHDVEHQTRRQCVPGF